MDKRILMLFACFLFVFMSVRAQVTQVSGVVTAEDDGQPITGASIRIEGTKMGTVTDIDGKFQLSNLPANARTLVITYMGMQTKKVTIKPNMKITLSADQQSLDDVIVVAFGKQKRESFTGSAGVIKTEDITKSQSSDAIESLNGKVAGVQMVESNDPAASSPTILIRGISSINAGTAPLIVVDGLPYNGYYSDLNPQDIESISVLKDAASNALYGARGANGVIMITTKQAKRGRATITVDAKWGGNSDGYIDYDYITDPREYYELYYKGLYNYYRNAQGQSSYDAWKSANSVIGGDRTNGGLGFSVFSVPNGQALIGQNGKMNPQATMGNVVTNNGKSYLLYPDNWKDLAFRTGLRQEYNVSVSGGNDQFQTYASGAYLKSEGVNYGSDFTRYNGMLKMDYQARKWLKIGGTARYTHNNANNNYDSFEGALSMPSIYPAFIRDANGNILTDDNGAMYDYGDGLVTGVTRPTDQGANFLQSDRLSYSNNNSNAFGFSAYSDISFLRDFKLTLNVNVFDTENRISYSSSPDYGYIGSASGGAADAYQYRTYSLNMQQLLNYNKNIGKHTIYLMLGHEYERDNSLETYVTRNQVLDYAADKEPSGALNLVDGNATTSVYNVEGYMFHAQYDYASKYFGSFSFRRDGSSRFAKHHRWGNFWSVGGAWIMSKENWFPKNTFMNMIKLKASYGEQGNDGIGDFRYTNFYTITSVNGKGALNFSQKGNEDITWETNGSFNAGVEFELFNHRITGSLEYYSRKTTDMLLFFTTPISLGYSGYYDNVGDMVNRGVEFTLSGDIIRTKNINWNVNFNISSNHNEVTYLPDENKTYNVEGHAGYVNLSDYRYVGEGLPLNTWYMPKYAGPDSQGRSSWYVTKEDGTIGTTTSHSEASYYLCGDANPKAFGGFGTTLTAYGFDLSASFIYSLGGKAYDTGYARLMASPFAAAERRNLHKDLWNAWSEDNTNSDIPRFQYGDTQNAYNSDRFLVSASSLTFKNLSLGYTLPQAWVSKLSLTSVRVYCMCDNLYYWTARKGLDPRNSLTGSVSITNFHPIRSISGGITVKF
jgi:TonB-linked SusC/RagA family outer membrane protein